MKQRTKEKMIIDPKRICVAEGEFVPFASVVVYKAAEGVFHAWQPEYGCYETAATMDGVLELVAATIGAAINNPEFDYLEKIGEGKCYWLPVCVQPDGLAQNGAAKKLFELFKITEPQKDNVLYAAVQPQV